MKILGILGIFYAVSMLCDSKENQLNMSGFLRFSRSNQAINNSFSTNEYVIVSFSCCLRLRESDSNFSYRLHFVNLGLLLDFFQFS